MRRVHRVVILALAIGACVGCDQATKSVAERFLSDHQVVSAPGGFLTFSYVENRGAFLSVGSSLSREVRFWLFEFATAIFLAMMLFGAIYGKLGRGAELASVGLMIGGGCGNLVDRLLWGYVRDFLVIDVGPIHTGVFNVADAAITVGCIGMLLIALRPDASRPSSRSLPRS